MSPLHKEVVDPLFHWTDSPQILLAWALQMDLVSTHLPSFPFFLQVNQITINTSLVPKVGNDYGHMVPLLVVELS